MSVEIEFTDEFAEWWSDLTENEQTKVSVSIELLRRFGVALSFPHSSGLSGSRHSQMRELRIQVEGRPYRVLYAFNPLRTGVLLIGGDKTGDRRWYEINVPVADRLYDEHLTELKKEDLL